VGEALAPGCTVILLEKADLGKGLGKWWLAWSRIAVDSANGDSADIQIVIAETDFATGICSIIEPSLGRARFIAESTSFQLRDRMDTICY
jgi:hypothetical protein